MKTIIAMLILSSGAVAQSLYDRVERILTQFNAHVARVLEQQEFEKRARFVKVRERKAASTIKRGQARASKLRRGIGRWNDEVRRLRSRADGLQRRTRTVRNSTMVRRYGSLIADVKRKVDQRETWIKRARKDLDKIEDARIQAQKVLVECAQIRDRLRQEALPQG